MFFKLIVLTSFITSLSTQLLGQEVSCENLIEYVKDNGYSKGRVSSFQLYQSTWLKTVEAYSIESTIVVIAEIKQSEWSFTIQKYIFCGISNSNWQAFYSGIYDLNKSYGERFHKYIIDNKCNCY